MPAEFFANDPHVACGFQILFEGEPFGFVHHWASCCEVSGASVCLDPKFRVRYLVSVGEHALYVSHVFLPNDLPAGFTVAAT